MQPRLSIIAASIRRILTSGFVEPTSDPYLDNVVLSLRMESSDPYYNQVVLGMHMDDVGLTDVKGHTVTLAGNTARSATQSKFGGYSAYFDGTGDYLAVTTDSGFDFGTGDFTIELWIYPTTIGTTAKYFLGKVVSWATNLDFSARIGTDGIITFYAGDNAPINIVSNSAVSINNWYHLAFVRSSGVTNMYVNGIKQSASHTGSVNVPNDSSTLYIGSYTNAGSEMYYGYIEDLRITQGVARYTKNFNVPTAAFPEPANTATDDKGNTVTSYGNSRYSGLSKYGGGSFYFDGTGDYLLLSTSLLSSEDFTVEAWIYPTAIPESGYIYAQYNNSTDAPNRTVFGYTSTGIYFQHGSTNLSPANGAPGLNTWSHIAFCRLGTTVYGFLNGVLMGTLTNFTGTLSSAIGSISAGYVGSWTQGHITGYLDDLRITKGVARYTSNFTPYKILTSAPAGDSFYNYTALLLKMNGTNGSTTFTDESYTPKTMTVFGNSNISTAQLKYGTASGYFDGTGDYLRTPYNAGFDPGDIGDYTAECWIYPTNVTSLRAIFGSYCNPSVTQGWILYQESSGALVLTTRDVSGTYGGVISSSNVLKINQWQHIAWTKTGKVNRLWLDGVKIAEATDTLNLYVNPSYGFIVGRWDDSGTTGRDFVGYMDDIRLTKGVARYTANFQPPGPHIAAIDPDTDQWWLNTVLALRMDGTHGSTTFTDLKGKTITPYGNASISSVVSKFGQAAYFDGTGDCLSVPNSSDFEFGTGDFTIEFWLNTSATNGTLIGKRPNVSWGPFVLGLNTNKLQVRLGTGSGSFAVDITSTDSINTGLWVHIAVTRASSTVRMFINGVVQSSTATLASSLYVVSNPVYIGANSDASGALTGYIDDLRITKNISRYTATFTPSEKPLPTYVVGPDHDQYWDKVVLACPFDTSLNDVRTKVGTAYGNAAISTTQKMFGDGSSYFDGTGDYVTYPHSSDLTLTSGDFTIEMWIYPLALTNCWFLSKDGIYGSIYLQYALGLDTDGYLNGVVGSGTSTNSYQQFSSLAGMIKVNTWTHIAYVKSGTTLNLFIDGILHKSVTQTATMGTSSGLLSLGRQPNDSGYYNGYLDDIRITKGVARYTANFEPPTKANILG